MKERMVRDVSKIKKKHNTMFRRNREVKSEGANNSKPEVSATRKHQ
jgi:hypothetical protein